MEPVMSLYRETTDGSTIEERDTILLWNYVHVKSLGSMDV
jgi:hypothetical protein